MATTIQQKLEAAIGSLIIQNVDLLTQVEILKERNAELEAAQAAKPEDNK